MLAEVSQLLHNILLEVRKCAVLIITVNHI